MSILAIIPARGGSKGIPRKNIRLLNGKPLIAYSIEQARQTPAISRVVVSTDDAEIGAVAQQYGAEVVWRPAEISGDTASSESALLHVLDHLAQTEGYEPELVVFLQCTAPLTLAEDISGTIQALLDQRADTAVAVVPFHYFLWKRDSKGNAIGVNHDKSQRLLRQQQDPQYLEAGAVYVMRTQGFRQARHRFFGKTALYVMPAERRLEIDEPVDFKIAELLLAERQKHERLQALPQPVAALVLDFDGVFTDNRVIVNQDGREAVLCDRSDGLGIARLKQLSVPILVLSTEENPVVQRRCEKLGIECIQGLGDKLATLKEWASARALSLAHMIYVGNDDNDVLCMEAVGCGVAVADAYPAARAAARFALESPGGRGAIREIADLIAVRMKEADHGA
ncbi:MAG: acylneuraminate cytidylyltransferase [Chloroflexota bacterium]|jgi:N-acylneuraminate cytidylyltransferase